MKSLVAGLLALLTVPIASAKGEIVRIEIAAATLATPLEITDPDVVDNFSVWTGPGVRINGQSVYQGPRIQSGAFINWAQGTVGRPSKGLPRYKVSLFCVFPRQRAPRLAYVVFYEDDPETGRGYMYLPGRGDEYYPLNTSSIVHGVEGHWFYASDVWERLVRPLVEHAAGLNHQ